LGQANVAARITNFLGVSRRDFSVIDDTGLRNMETLDASGVGFELFQPFGSDDFQPLKPIRDAAPVQFFQARQFFFARRDDDFATDLVGYGVVVAECD